MAEAEDKIFDWTKIQNIKTEFLETFEFGSSNQYIKTESKEFSALCPFSGLPDYGHLIIEYYPQGKKCIELKSLKYYILTYRNVKLYQEQVTRQIYDDLKKVLETSRIKVTTIYNIRGGFLTTCIEGNL